MPRPHRISFPGALYHVSVRGNNGGVIVHDDFDRRDLLATCAGAIGKFGWRCHAFCLMDNHFHLILETPEGNISSGMQRLNGTYAQHFNRRHKRTGHLFQGRFHAPLVDCDSHLLEASRYVVLNPIRAGLCSHPGAWPWSSYRATAGLAARPPFLTVTTIHAMLGRDIARAMVAYRRFVADAR